jgi:hypothetical protein
MSVPLLACKWLWDLMLGNFTTVYQDVPVLFNVGTVSDSPHTDAHVFLCTFWAQLFTRLSERKCFPTEVAKDETQYIRLYYCCLAMFWRSKEAGRFSAKLGIPKLYFSQTSLKREAEYGSVSALTGLDTFCMIWQIRRWLVGLCVVQRLGLKFGARDIFLAGH